MQHSLSRLFQVLLLTIVVIHCALPADAALSKPIRGADLRNSLTAEEMERAKYFWAVKGSILEKTSLDSVLALQKVEKAHDLAKLAIGIGDVFLSIGDYANKNGDKIVGLARLTKDLDKRRLLKYSTLKRLTPETAEVAIQFVLVLGDMASQMDQFSAIMGGKQLFPDLSSLTPEAVGTFLESYPGQVITNVVVEVLPVLTSVQECKGLLQDVRHVAKLFKNRKAIQALRLAWKAKAAINPADYATTAAGITVDLTGAALVADINSDLKSRLLGLDFLDYYYVTYKGDWDTYMRALNLYGGATVEKAFANFVNQKSEYGGTFKEYYDNSGWFESLFNGYSTGDTLATIRRAATESGPLAVRIAPTGGAGAITAGDKVTYTVNIDPMLAGEYALGNVQITQTDPAGRTSLYSIFSQGSFTPEFSTPGYSRFMVHYTITQGGSGTSQNHDFVFYKTAMVSDAVAPEPTITAGTAASDADGGYQFPVTVTLPTADLTAGSLAFPPMAPTVIRARLRYNTDTRTDIATDWQEIPAIAGGSATFLVDVAHPGAVLEKHGALGDYTVDLEVNHPFVQTLAVRSTQKRITYTDLNGLSGADPAYLLVTLPDREKAAPDTDTGFLFLDPADSIRLEKANDSSSFASLADISSIRVYLEGQDGNVTSCPGTYSDGGINFNAAGLAAGRYRFIAVAGTTADGEKYPIPLGRLLIQVRQDQVAGSDTTPGGGASPGGGVVAWGQQVWGFPGMYKDIKAIAARSDHSLALKGDGTVVAWGENGSGQSSVPAGLRGVVAIAAGYVHSLALKGDGTVVAWGYDGYGQSSVPAGLGGVVAIAAGEYHSLALRGDGTVVAWGYNGSGESSVLAGLSGVVAIAGGDYHSLALKGDGTVVAWGENGYGQSSVPAGLSGVVAIAAGRYHSLALKGDGTVVAWGYNRYGQSSVPAELGGVVAIAAGYEHSLALKGDGTVVAWGRNDLGQSSIPAGLSGVRGIAAGPDISVVLADTIPDSPVFLKPTVTILSENLPDGSYVVGPATKTWHFRNGATTSNLSLNIVRFNNLNMPQCSPDQLNIAPNGEFSVSCAIEPSHYSASGDAGAVIRLVGAEITNAKDSIISVKVSTNKPPVFSPLQLDSVAGSVGNPLLLPLLAADPEQDSITYRVTSGGGSLQSNYDSTGRFCTAYSNTFTTPGVYPVTVEADDNHGGTARFTFQAVISDGSGVSRLFTDVPYPSDPVTDNQQYDQYLAIHYLALKGVVIGRPENPLDLSNANRIFQPQQVANQAEALAMLMKTAQLRGFMKLDTGGRQLPNLISEDAANNVFYNFSWVAPYVLKAEELGMIDKAENFEPAAPATRDWMARMLSQLLGLAPPLDSIADQSAYSFADAADFSSTDAYDAARAAAFFGYLGHLGGAAIFNPRDAMIRADVAVVASRVLRTPSFDAIETAGLSAGSVDGSGTITEGMSFNVTGLRNLKSYRILDNGGRVSEDQTTPPQDYVKASVIRAGSGILAEPMANFLATSPVVVPTNPPAVTASIYRDLLVVATDTDSGIRAVERQKYYVYFQDTDGDGVRDQDDYFPFDSLHWQPGPTATISFSQSGTGACVESPGLAGDSCFSMQPFAIGSVVTLQAIARNGVSFIRWSGACNGSDPECMLTMDANKTVEAIFSDAATGGTCGSSDGASFASAPDSNLCSAGTPSGVSGAGPWSWTCAGSNGGTTASCSAQKQGSLKAGDADGNGSVSIAEVQSAINMYLGLKQPASCVDADGNGSVSIAEVQKSINSYLGL